MNTSMKLKLAATSLFMMALFSCNDVPSEYRGTFIDQPSGTQLTLGSSDATLNSAGRALKADVDSVDLNDLAAGKPGLYTRASQSNENVIELIWVIPDVASRKENSNFVWFKAEFLYLRMNSEEKNPVQSVQVEHCTDGDLMLDLPTKNWNGGCPENTQVMTMQRYNPK